MIFKNTTSQKIISFFLIIAVLSPAFIIFSMPKKIEAAGAPVFDASLFAKEVWKVIKETIKQFLMTVARRLLDKMTQSTINWINSGFRGKPLFIENPDSFFKDIAKTEIKNFIEEIGYDPARFPFGKSYALGVINQAKSTFERNAQYSLSKMYSESELEYQKNTFSWNNFLISTQYPQNNFLGFDLEASNELARRLNKEIEKVEKKVEQGMGFLSMETCKSNPNWSPDKLEKGPVIPPFVPVDISFFPPGYNPTKKELEEMNKTEKEKWLNQKKSIEEKWKSDYSCPEGPSTTTPGSQIASTIMNALGSKQRQGELGAALGNSLAALFDALINKFFNMGLTALSNAITPTPNPKISDFNYFGDISGSNQYLGNPPINPEPKITINLSIINDNSGTAIESDIQVYINGNRALIGTPFVYEPGNHTITVNTPSGYITNIGEDCDSFGNISLGIGEIKVCSVIVDDI